MGRRKLVYGVGLNDANYVVSPMINGKRFHCPFYLKWKAMLERCYSNRCKGEFPSYAECRVDQRWLVFTEFKKWMELQDWKGKHLDKDILIEGNKIYSPDNCVLVDQRINSFFICQSGECVKQGISWHKKNGKFIARFSNVCTGKLEHLGYFSDKDEAHLAWRRRKHELALDLAKTQTDQRVVSALITRYS